MSDKGGGLVERVPTEPYGGTTAALWRTVAWHNHDYTARIGGRSVHYIDIGSGDIPVLLLHGHGSSWQYWLEVAALLAASGRRVVAVDLPGFGQSEAIPFAESSMDALTATLSGLLDQLAVARCDVVGHSFGTIAAIELAVAESHRVCTLTLAGGPALSIVELFRHPLKTMWRFPALALTVVSDMVTAGLPIPRPILRLISRHGWLRRLGFGSYVRRPAELSADLCEQLTVGVGARAYFHLPLKAKQFRRAEPTQIQCPVLLVNGDRDAFVPATDVAQFLREVPHARSHVLEGAGHLVTVEFPATFVGLFGDFCRDVEAREISRTTG